MKRPHETRPAPGAPETAARPPAFGWPSTPFVLARRPRGEAELERAVMALGDEHAVVPEVTRRAVRAIGGGDE
jgi:hypothetical protein